ncbi:DNA-binding protein satb2 [Blomia tropicalis]|nr:DNA-binding protein satb2 [Blomia tropicalis]
MAPLFEASFAVIVPKCEIGNIQWNHSSVRAAILSLLHDLSQSKLSKLCNITQPIISHIVNNKDFKLNQNKCQEFGVWYEQYSRSKSNLVSCEMSNIQSQDNVSNLISNINIDNDEKVQSQSDARLTFHSKQEVPRLVEWFNLDRNPSERQLSYYADLLNQSPLRVERNKVTIKSLKNWWKNYKQKQRNELKERKRK